MGILLFISTSYFYYLRLSMEVLDIRPEVSDREEGFRLSTHQGYFNGEFRIEAWHQYILQETPYSLHKLS